MWHCQGSSGTQQASPHNQRQLNHGSQVQHNRSQKHSKGLYTPLCEKAWFHHFSFPCLVKRWYQMSVSNRDKSSVPLWFLLPVSSVFHFSVKGGHTHTIMCDLKAPVTLPVSVSDKPDAENSLSLCNFGFTSSFINPKPNLFLKRFLAALPRSTYGGGRHIGLMQLHVLVAMAKPWGGDRTGAQGFSPKAGWGPEVGLQGKEEIPFCNLSSSRNPHCNFYKYFQIAFYRQLYQYTPKSTFWGLFLHVPHQWNVTRLLQSEKWKIVLIWFSFAFISFILG